MLQVRDQHHSQTKVIALAGQFYRHTTAGIHGQILTAHKLGFHHIILDFSGVTEIDSTGLGELFLWYHNMRPHHVHISIVKPLPYIRSHLNWSRLSEIVPIYESEQEAIGAARAYS